MVGNRGHRTLSDEVLVASEFVAPGQSIGRKISGSICMACVQAMEALVEVGTVLPRAVRVSVTCIIVPSADNSVGVAQCIGYSRHMSATQYCLVPGV
jgi:hypothetical protein